MKLIPRNIESYTFLYKKMAKLSFRSLNYLISIGLVP